VDDFSREVGEAFGEVSERGMPIRFKFSNDAHTGVVMSLKSEATIREPGYEGMDSIQVYCPLKQFAILPEYHNARETLSILEGPNQGDWTVVAVNQDVAHVIFTAVPKE
jgi:hypothetical protein